MWVTELTLISVPFSVSCVDCFLIPLFIWTDVDGILIADPRLVPDAVTIPEVSYQEVAEFAYFGAKVLHPKAIRPLLKFRTSVWIRNTFSPERPGTKIVPERKIETTNGVTGLTAMRNVVLVTVSGPGIVVTTDALSRAAAATAAMQAEIVMISQSFTQNKISFVMPSSGLEIALEALQREFSRNLEYEKATHISVNTKVAILTAVVQTTSAVKGIPDRIFGVLLRESINVLAFTQGASECALSFLLALDDIDRALLPMHREFQLGARQRQAQART